MVDKENAVKVGGTLVNVLDPNGTIADASQIEVDNKTLAAKLAEMDQAIAETGSSGVEIVELESANLNDDSLLNKNIIYNIKQAENSPIGTAGKLSVIETESGWYQSWQAEEGVAYRIANYGNGEESDVTVDGPEGWTLKDGVLSLPAQETYTLSGYLNGRIEITADNPESLQNETVIILNGLYINSNSGTAISYPFGYKKLVITLAAEKQNYIYCKTETPGEELLSTGAVHSDNNLEINGVGCISIYSNYKNHGIRGSEIAIKDRPHIYIDCANGHDGIHAGKTLIAENGVITIDNAKDAIGIGSSENGVLRIFAGEYNFNHYSEHAIDGKDLPLNGYLYESEKLTYNFTQDDCSNKVIFVNDSNANLYFGAGHITRNNNGTIEDVYPVQGDAVALGGDGSVFTISGVITKDINVNGQSIDLVLENAYILGDIVYTPTKKKLLIKSNDDDTVGSKTSKNYVNIIKGNIQSGNNLTISGKAPLLVSGDITAGNKLIITGDGSKLLDNCTCGKYYFGANDDDIDAFVLQNAAEPGNSKQTVYINSIEYTATVETNNGNKGAPSIYKYQIGSVLIADGSDEYFRNAQGQDAGFETKGIYDEVASRYYNYISDPEIVADDDFENSDLIISGITQKWMVLKENPDIDLSDYAKKEDVKNMKVFTNLEAAEAAAANGELEIGEVVSVGGGASLDGTLLTEYSIYIVSLGYGAVPTLTEIKGGGGESSLGDLTFNVEGITISKTDGTTETIQVSDTSFEANIGDVIRFKMSFISQYYPNVRAQVKCQIGSGTPQVFSILPSDGNFVDWAIDTSKYTSGTYSFIMYGVESTGRLSERKVYRAQIGGLNLKSNLDENKIIPANTDLLTQLTLEVANAQADHTLSIYLNGELYEEKSIQPGNTNITIPKASLSTGEQVLEFVVVNSLGKSSNRLKYSLIIAEDGVIYFITDKSEYVGSSGGRFYITARTAQIGMTNSNFPVVMVVYDKDDNVVTVNGRTENEYQLPYGRSLIQVVGLKYTTADRTVEDVKQTYYKAVFTVSSEDILATPVTKSVDIYIAENNYNIEPLADDSLLCWFSAEGQSNQSASRASWTDLSVPYRNGGEPVTAKFNNFNWIDNGWLPDSEGNTALTMNAGAYVELDISPFGDAEPGHDSAGNLISTGMTVSIDFQSKNILNEDAKVLSCLYE